jgi:hypothetical protein
LHHDIARLIGIVYDFKMRFSIPLCGGINVPSDILTAGSATAGAAVEEVASPVVEGTISAILNKIVERVVYWRE